MLVVDMEQIECGETALRDSVDTCPGGVAFIFEGWPRLQGERTSPCDDEKETGNHAIGIVAEGALRKAKGTT